MNRQIIKNIPGAAVCLVLGLLLVSCDASLPDTEGNNEVTIRLSMPDAMELTTKAGTLDEINIGNVWVLQYSDNALGVNNLLRAGKYTNITATGASPGTLKVETSGFSDVNSRFYVIANAPENFLVNADTVQGGNSNISEADLMKKTVGLTDNKTSQPTFLTAGPLLLTQDSIQKYGGKAVVVAPLERAYAQMEIQWAKSAQCVDKIVIKKVDICNVPENMAVYARGGADLNSKYPAVVTTGMKDTVHIVNSIATDGWGSSSEKAKFWMPENLRGMGTGNSFSEKSMPNKGPDSSLSGCTFVLLSGTYQYSLGSGVYSSAINVQYKIFLGGNLTNDYNIQRGFWYKLTVNIGGANSADVRVTITDGRVAVFDDVKVMDPIIVDF